ncbi:MAG: recombinase family protein, partial [Angelakisella sp.]
ARVSTEKDEQLHSLSAQVRYYSDFIQANSNWTFVEGYIDEGLSATSVTKRDSFLRMIDDAKLGKFDFIITKEISRFSRNTLDSIRYTQELLRQGVGVLFQSDNINTLEPDAELRLTIMSSLAQDEVRKISERVKFGFKRAIEKGVVLGSNRIWGYRKQEGRLVIVEQEAEMVRLIFDLYANQRMGIRSVAAWLTENGYRNTKGNEFSFSTIKGILVNPKYKGYYCGNKTHKYDYKMSDVKVLDPEEWVIYKDEEGDTVPAIVSEELWDKANRILNERSEKQSAEDKTSYQNKYAYSGKILCMEHNVAFYRAEYKYKSGNKEVWQCRKYATAGKSGCTSPILYTTEINDIMKQVLDGIIIDKARIINDLIKIYSGILTSTDLKNDIAKCKTEINTILQKKDKLLDLSIKGRLSDEEFEDRNTRFNKEIEELQTRITDYEGQEDKNRDVAQTVNILRDLIASELDFKEGIDANIIEALLDRIEVYPATETADVVLKVYLKLVNEEQQYGIIRRRGKTSFCTRLYT